MRIRVGVKGDRKMSQAIHSLVLAELQATPDPYGARQPEVAP